jgi:hypothetical protein
VDIGVCRWQEYLIEAHPKNMRRIAKSWPLKARDGAIRLPGSLWCRGGGSGGGDDGGCSRRSRRQKAGYETIANS